MRSFVRTVADDSAVHFVDVYGCRQLATGAERDSGKWKQIPNCEVVPTCSRPGAVEDRFYLLQGDEFVEGLTARSARL